MAKEVYRSFEGSLDVETQTGYIITELADFYEIEFLDVFNDSPDKYARIKKSLLSEKDFADKMKIEQLIDDIECGRADTGQAYYKGKWYGYDTICKLQKGHQDYRWKKFVK